jgi:excinuclease UvrABC ATPase subunit
MMTHAEGVMGRGAGHDGGRIIFQGTPDELVVARSTVTASTWRRNVGQGYPEAAKSG